MKDNMFAALIGHPGGYYSTVSGGELGDTYTAEVLVSPPNINRVNVFDLIFGFGQYVLYSIGDALTFWDIQGANPDLYIGLDFDNANLGWSILTSELPSLNMKKEYTYVNTKGSNSLLSQYRTNTLGYLEGKVSEASNGKLNAIRATCVNGAPSYQFINRANYSLVMPETPLYKPVVLSQERYDELSIPNGHIIIEVAAKDYENT